MKPMTLASFEQERQERWDRADASRSMKQVERWLLIGNMAKSVGHKPLSGLEKDIILLVFTEGRGGKYSATGRHTLHSWLAERLDADRGNVGKAVRSLVRRGYAEQGTTAKGAEYLWLTSGLFWSADIAERRWRFKQFAGELWPLVLWYGIGRADKQLLDEHEDSLDRGGRALTQAFSAVLLDICRAYAEHTSQRAPGRKKVYKGGSPWLPSNVRELNEYRRLAEAKAL
jgi:hypothetical protein